MKNIYENGRENVGQIYLDLHGLKPKNSTVVTPST